MRKEINKNEFLKNNFPHESKGEKFKCEYNECDRSYKYERSLKLHQRIHLGIIFSCVWFSCKYETIYFYEDHLERHALTHSEKRKFKCDISCISEFLTISLILLHILDAYLLHNSLIFSTLEAMSFFYKTLYFKL
jgi:hypothetical protein